MHRNTNPLTHHTGKTTTRRSSNWSTHGRSNSTTNFSFFTCMLAAKSPHNSRWNQTNQIRSEFACYREDDVSCIRSVYLRRCSRRSRRARECSRTRPRWSERLSPDPWPPPAGAWGRRRSRRMQGRGITCGKVVGAVGGGQTAGCARAEVAHMEEGGWDTWTVQKANGGQEHTEQRGPRAVGWGKLESRIWGRASPHGPGHLPLAVGDQIQRRRVKMPQFISKSLARAKI
jgi:hypothetical protein